MRKTLFQGRPLRGAEALSQMRRDVVCLAALTVVLVVSWVNAVQGNSADLMALYAAALAHAQGAPELVYPGGPLFNMVPPEGWYTMMRAEGYEGELYPYLYPPLWVAVLSPVVEGLSPSTVATAAPAVNHALLLLSLWLAWRITGRSVPLLPFLALGGALTFLTLPGLIGLQESQPQMLVGTLMLAALERNRAGAPVAAGLALAFAAALKIYPGFFAVIWLFTRDWRAFCAFAGLGAALALASIALAGWPLHQEFLRTLEVVSRSVVVTSFSYGLNPLIGQFLPLQPGDVVLRPDMPVDEGVTGTAAYVVLRKDDAWILASKLLPIAAAVAAGIAMRVVRPETRNLAIWPLAFIAVTFVSPIPWAYSYLCAMAFVPALFAVSPRIAMAAVVGGVLPLFGPFAAAASGLLPGHTPVQILGTLAVAVLGGAFVAVALRMERGAIALPPFSAGRPVAG